MVDRLVAPGTANAMPSSEQLLKFVLKMLPLFATVKYTTLPTTTMPRPLPLLWGHVAATTPVVLSILYIAPGVLLAELP